MNTITPKEHGSSDCLCDPKNTQDVPIRIYVVFNDPEHADLFEKMIKRITKHDLREMLFPEREIDALLAALGSVRVPLKQLRTSSIKPLEKP